MDARRIIYRGQRWSLCRQSAKYFTRPKCQGEAFRISNSTCILEHHQSVGSSVRGYFSGSFTSWGVPSRNRYTGLYTRSKMCLNSTQLCCYSSEGDGRNASEDKQVPVRDSPQFDKGKTRREKITENARHPDVHAQLGKQDQEEWLNNEKLSFESKKQDFPFLTRRERFKNEFLRRVVPWEKITVSWENFPYYVNEHTKNLLVECAASHLKQKNLAASYGSRLASSSGKILLLSIPGSELYCERLVRALARDLRVPLLILDSNILVPYDFGDDSECETDDDNVESGEEGMSESEVEDDNNASDEEGFASTSESKSDCSDEDVVEVQAAAEEACMKLAPYNLEEFEKRVSGESDSNVESSKSGDAEPSDKSKRPLKKGDRVKYVGPSVHNEADNRIILGKIQTSAGPKNAYTKIRGRHLCNGQGGEIFEVNGGQAAVIFDATESDAIGGKRDEKDTKQPAEPLLYWIDVKDIEHDYDTQARDCYIAIEALCEVLRSSQPLIVYFGDSSQWLSRAVPKSDSKEFVDKVQEMFEQLSGPVVLVCWQDQVDVGSEKNIDFVTVQQNSHQLPKWRLMKLLKIIEGSDMSRVFTNVLTLNPPEEEDLLRTFNKQLEEDRRVVVSRSNLNELHKVLEENELSCTDLLHVNTDGIILTNKKAEKVVGWAKNHHLSSCLAPSTKGGRLCLPRESIEIATSRLREREEISRKPSQKLENIAEDEYESNFISAVVAPGEIGVKFDDIGALENVKKALNELVILPMRRPELFSSGNLLRPCKGILLFGPPGTGKTLLAKALATEAGANFISITGSTLTSKWFGDAEKLTERLFSFASKLVPVIIFIDEVDSLLGARGGLFEHEVTRQMRNIFMAAWDGLRSKDSQRILILAATNRPFDLDDAVIRRLPRRIYVDLPDAVNRMKILRIFLAQENLEPGFAFDKLANATEGYSGSDLKNLCIAAAYRPVQELLDEERKYEHVKGDNVASSTVLRPLRLDDFIQSKAKVGPSVAYDSASMNELRKWNEQYGEGGSRRKSPFGF